MKLLRVLLDHKILQRPLEKLPKADNKTKRKKL